MIVSRLNGFIFQKEHGGAYRGVDGDNWYLNDCPDAGFREFYDLHIDRAWAGAPFVDCCDSLDYLRRYVDKSLSLGIQFRLLLCKTAREQPQLLGVDLTGAKRLGLDYAYSGGDYYSCIKNDILSNRISELAAMPLNGNGLFESEEGLAGFIRLRRELEKASPRDIFEGGDFIAYELFEVGPSLALANGAAAGAGELQQAGSGVLLHIEGRPATVPTV